MKSQQNGGGNGMESGQLAAKQGDRLKGLYCFHLRAIQFVYAPACDAYARIKKRALRLGLSQCSPPNMTAIPLLQSLYSAV